MIDFTKATISVPELPVSKSFNVWSKLTISVWIKLPPWVSGHYEHLFTFPRSESADIRLVQLYFQDVNTYFACHASGIPFYGGRPKTREWQHVVLTVQVSTPGNKVALYSNGKFVEEKFMTTDRVVSAGSNPQKGFVLGQDVDGSTVDNTQESFRGQITKLYIYNDVLTDEEIKACYEHREPMDGRIVWWEEFQGLSTSNNDVQETNYPEQFYFR